MADIMPAGWLATRVWLDSSECAIERGVWLAVCEKGKLVPISERAIADDPGHALLLDLWSMATRSRATQADVARLNTLLDALGLLALAGLLFSLRAYITAITLMWLGPVEYVGWMGTSPHWSFIGLVSLCAVLPIALAAKDLGLLSRRSGNLWIAAGLVFLALATLVRELIGIMGLLISLGVLGALILRRPRTRQRLAPLLLAGVLALAVFTTPRWVVLARDASFDMQPAQRLATHGLSHTLYLGLGFVENKWGIRYDDDYGEEIADKADPPVVFCSPEYFRLMWKLYLARWAEDPVEVIAHLRRQGVAAARRADALSWPALRHRAADRPAPSAGGDGFRRLGAHRLPARLRHRRDRARLRRAFPRPGHGGAAQPDLRPAGQRLRAGAAGGHRRVPSSAPCCASRQHRDPVGVSAVTCRAAC